MVQRQASPLRGAVSVPGDKSISHRAVMLAALAEGTSIIRNWLPAGDTLATLEAIRDLGVTIEIDERSDLAWDLRVQGHGLNGFRKPSAPLDCRNAGTTIRLLSGIMAGQTSNIVLGVLAALAVAVVFGLVNGLIVSLLNVHGFIATLGTGLVVSGYLGSNYQGSHGSAPLHPCGSSADHGIGARQPSRPPGSTTRSGGMSASSRPSSSPA